ncbi:amidohydrolase family protein [bacterium]|nr:amidohydrolase family protein [bacterium]
MRIVDCHVHMKSKVSDVSDILRAMDKNGVARMLVISKRERKSLEETRKNLQQTKSLCDQAPDRLTGLAWLEPTIHGMKELAREALCNMGFAGIKIIPDHWYVHEDRLEPWWELMNELEARILFHTGILYAFEDGSRFCHPVYLEKLLHYPKILFAMAHISWPWCEECLAVMGRMRAAKNPQWQSYIDVTPGTPPHIRKQALFNALDFCGPDRLMFGTDLCIPGCLSTKKQIDTDLAIFDEFGLNEAQKGRIFSGTADELFPSTK